MVEGKGGGSRGKLSKPHYPHYDRRRTAQKERACEIAKVLQQGASQGGSDGENLSALVSKVREWADALRASEVFSHLRATLLKLATLKKEHNLPLELAPEESVLQPSQSLPTPLTTGPLGLFGAMSCLGVGNFSRSRPALLQLALALCLMQDVKRDCGEADDQKGCDVCCHETVDEGEGDDPLLVTQRRRCLFYCYDPFFSDTERAACAALGFVVPSEGEPALAPPLHSSSTGQNLILYYMPHCPRSLYNRVLQRNFSCGRLSNVVLVGNSFASYALRTMGGGGHSGGSTRDAGCDVLVSAPPAESTLHRIELMGLFAPCTVEVEWWTAVVALAGKTGPAVPPPLSSSSSSPSSAIVGGGGRLSREMSCHLEAAFNDSNAHHFFPLGAAPEWAVGGALHAQVPSTAEFEAAVMVHEEALGGSDE